MEEDALDVPASRLSHHLPRKRSREASSLGCTILQRLEAWYRVAIWCPIGIGLGYTRSGTRYSNRGQPKQDWVIRCVRRPGSCSRSADPRLTDEFDDQLGA